MSGIFFWILNGSTGFLGSRAAKGVRDRKTGGIERTPSCQTGDVGPLVINVPIHIYSPALCTTAAFKRKIERNWSRNPLPVPIPRSDASSSMVVCEGQEFFFQPFETRKESGQLAVAGSVFFFCNSTTLPLKCAQLSSCENIVICILVAIYSILFIIQFFKSSPPMVPVP